MKRSQISKLSRREFLRGAGLTAGALLLAGCVQQVQPAAPQQAAQGEAAAPQPPPAEPVKLELWTFVNTHARWFRSMAESYKEEKNSDFELNVSEIAYGDMHDKTQIALQSGGVGAPDLVDLEQGRFGGFLRGTSDPGLVDLADWLKGEGYLDQLVASREALYTYQGKIYGVEHALTPVVLYYRADVIEGAGVDVSTIETWEQWIAAVKPVVHDDVVVHNFPAHEVLLRQRDGDYFTADGQVALDTDLSIEAMQWILDLRDKHEIARQDPGGDAWWAALKEGKFLAFVGADWYAGFFKDNAPELSGMWKAMPVPAWEAGGLRTSCWGGTGNCIVRYSKYVDVAWDFMKFSMLSVEGNVRRFEETNLFPPYIPAMDNERLHKSDEYFSGQDLGQIFADLAPDVPAQYQSPYRSELNSDLGAMWQDIYDLKVTPEEAFTKVAEDIRKVMAEESG